MINRNDNYINLYNFNIGKVEIKIKTRENNFKVILISLLFLGSFILTSCVFSRQVFADNPSLDFDVNQILYKCDISPSKTWVIKFSTPLDKASAQKAVTVTDPLSNKINSLVSLSEDEKSIVVDRPFLFLIRDNTTGIILFMGKVENPKY